MSRPKATYRKKPDPDEVLAPDDISINTGNAKRGNKHKKRLKRNNKNAVVTSGKQNHMKQKIPIGPFCTLVTTEDRLSMLASEVLTLSRLKNSFYHSVSYWKNPRICKLAESASKVCKTLGTARADKAGCRNCRHREMSRAINKQINICMPQ